MSDPQSWDDVAEWTASDYWDRFSDLVERSFTQDQWKSWTQDFRSNFLLRIYRRDGFERGYKFTQLWLATFPLTEEARLDGEAVLEQP